MLHMGNGDHSAAKAFELVTRLHEAFGDLSGLQQIGLQGTPHDQYESDMIMQRLINTSVDIAHALTGVSKKKLFHLMVEELKGR